MKAATDGAETPNRIYDIVVLLDYDETKSARHERDRGIGFDRFSSMDLTVSVASDDDYQPASSE